MAIEGDRKIKVVKDTEGKDVIVYEEKREYDVVPEAKLLQRLSNLRGRKRVLEAKLQDTQDQLDLVNDRISNFEGVADQLGGEQVIKDRVDFEPPDPPRIRPADLDPPKPIRKKKKKKVGGRKVV